MMQTINGRASCRINGNMRSVQIRPSKELLEIINYVKAKHILEGRKPPTVSNITRVIAKRINKEDILHNEFIKL